jgi:hypothetical protein
MPVLFREKADFTQQTAAIRRHLSWLAGDKPKQAAVRIGLRT